MSEKKKMSRKTKNIIAGAVAAAIFAGAGIWGYVYWQDHTYFETNNAKVASKTYNVAPSLAGALSRLTVKEGDLVKENEIIGRIDTGAYLRSPAQGKVVKIGAAENQLVAQTSVVAVIADTADVFILANIEETEISRVAAGQSVEVRLDAHRGKRFEGYVSEIESATQAALTGANTGLTTSGTYSKVTQLIPVKIR
ncbi:MAG: efflux RND transporter periplasmic adaptor subunit, partial [Peptococcaceae bacterium]|nr:efflux RND transporter periplasmic adaptor subunit [Peptococcaceae bacterium]